eukprot:TRINITY_DN3582_c0_g1_i9.p1 TRINITY_DN3582_c0_g1~~TRINITY_DN3582_c0_g1_i9.p1  ORF type:complete len:145 (+),score=29.96 TRINITY_DN3582_c0_g1_i9:1138-1572(+)
MQLHIDIPLKSPVVMSIEKECSKETLVDRLAEKIVSNEKAYTAIKFGLIIFAVLGVAYAVFTCNNLCKGKTLSQSIPCGTCLCSCCIKTSASAGSSGGDAASRSTAQTMGGANESTVVSFCSLEIAECVCDRLGSRRGKCVFRQ